MTFYIHEKCIFITLSSDYSSDGKCPPLISPSQIINTNFTLNNQSPIIYSNDQSLGLGGPVKILDW